MRCAILLETCCLSCVTVRHIMQRAVHLSKNFGTLQFQSIMRSTFSDCESRFENRVLYKSDRVERDPIPVSLRRAINVIVISLLVSSPHRQSGE